MSSNFERFVISLLTLLLVPTNVVLGREPGRTVPWSRVTHKQNQAATAAAQRREQLGEQQSESRPK
jgi:hypothetical protein